MEPTFISADELFWKIVDQTHRDSDGNVLKQKNLFEKQLAEIDNQHLILFHLQFTQLRLQAYRWNIYLAFKLITKQNNEDDFYNFREWLIMQGKNNFYSILTDPDLLINSKKENIMSAIELVETIGYLPKKILQTKAPFYSLTFQTEIPGDDWADSAISSEKILPQLWRKYKE